MIRLGLGQTVELGFPFRSSCHRDRFIIAMEAGVLKEGVECFVLGRCNVRHTGWVDVFCSR